MNPIEELQSEYEAIAKHLEGAREISLLNNHNKNFRKILLLAAGSFFEYQITSILSDFARKKSGNDQRLITFLEKQAISQKYHQLFDWGQKDNPEKPQKNANAFWKLFGDSFKAEVDQSIKTDEETRKAIEAFLEIGHLRNILVHSNLAAYNYDQKTSIEIFHLYRAALPFLAFLRNRLDVTNT